MADVAKADTVDHLLHRGETDLLFSTLLQAQQIAESTQDQQGLADALSLLGQAYCNATTVAIVKSGALPFGTQGQGKYEEALAYQQQALGLQEALHDTRGISESHFCIGLVYQFWQQHELAREHFIRAIQVAEEAGDVLEQAEPHRHLTVDALFKGDLEAALTHAKRLCCKKKADLVELAETSERGSHYDRATPIQMAPLPGRHHFVVRAVVSAVFTQLPRSGRNDARAGIACGSYHDLPMGPTLCS